MLHSCVLPLLLAAFLLQVHLSYSDTASLLKCPCQFMVSRRIDGTAKTNREGFDVLVDRVLSPNSGFIRRSEKHSLRSFDLSKVGHTDSIFHHFTNLNIADAGLFRVSVRHHGLSETAPQYFIQQRYLARQIICPVVIPQDPPSVRKVDATEYEIGSHRQIIADEPPPENETISYDPLIVGGLKVSPDLLPFVVSIATPATFCIPGLPCNVAGCTGTLISPRWVLTAAHCNIKTTSRVYVSTNTGSRGSFTTVSRIFTHPQYKVDGVAGQPYDITVFELAVNVDECCNPRPKFMEINFDWRSPKVGCFARIAGYGRIWPDDSITDPSPRALRQVDLPIPNQGQCAKKYSRLSSPLSLSRRMQLCEGYIREGGCDSCSGDSGGPVVQYDGNKPVLLSVISAGVRCGVSAFPGISVRLSGHRKWLQSTPAEFTVHRGELSPTCLQCNAGEFLRYVPGVVSTCTTCPDIGFSVPTMRACFRCRGTLWRDTVRGDRCSCRRRVGYGFTRNNCVICPAGTFSGFGQNKCSRCPRNTFSDEAGASQCMPCPGARRGSTSCNTSELDS